MLQPNQQAWTLCASFKLRNDSTYQSGNCRCSCSHFSPKRLGFGVLKAFSVSGRQTSFWAASEVDAAVTAFGDAFLRVSFACRRPSQRSVPLRGLLWILALPASKARDQRAGASSCASLAMYRSELAALSQHHEAGHGSVAG